MFTAPVIGSWHSTYIFAQKQGQSLSKDLVQSPTQRHETGLQEGALQVLINPETCLNYCKCPANLYQLLQGTSFGEMVDLALYTAWVVYILTDFINVLKMTLLAQSMAELLRNAILIQSGL